MASFKKFTAGAVMNQIRHVERTIENPSNTNIEQDKLDSCYNLAPYRGMSSYSYFKQLIDSSYVYGRADVKVMAGIVCTAPHDLRKEQEDSFFEATYDFIAERYGEENIITAPVHKDETDCRPHIHVLICPRVKDNNPKHEQEYKICMNDVLTRDEYRDFHSAYQEYLNKVGIRCTVSSGITKRQGGNKDSRQYKKELAEKQNDPDALKKAWGNL